ncbi:MAG: alkaline shock response membrane anchor protein AmaP [Bacillota bacterium]
MSAIWKSVLALYNLVLIGLSVIAVALALGNTEPLLWINEALSTSQNRLITGGTGVLLAVVGLYLMIQLFRSGQETEVLVQESDAGKVIITVPAIKQIVLKAVKQVEGVREAKPEVTNEKNGVVVSLTLMVNPDYKIPEMTATVQEKVAALLEEVGGLRVAHVRIKVDDFAPKPAVR